MKNKYRVDFQVNTEVPQEFFFFFFLRSIIGEKFSIALKDISVSSLNFLSKTRKLEDGREFKDYRFMSVARLLREMSLDAMQLENLSDSQFSQEMCMRFEKAKRNTKDELTNLFTIENDETVSEVYQDFLVRWSVSVGRKGKKERKTEQEIISVLVGYSIVPKVNLGGHNV